MGKILWIASRHSRHFAGVSAIAELPATWAEFSRYEHPGRRIRFALTFARALFADNWP
jgi:hypothetical protein